MSPSRVRTSCADYPTSPDRPSGRRWRGRFTCAAAEHPHPRADDGIWARTPSSSGRPPGAKRWGWITASANGRSDYVAKTIFIATARATVPAIFQGDMVFLKCGGMAGVALAEGGRCRAVRRPACAMLGGKGSHGRPDEDSAAPGSSCRKRWLGGNSLPPCSGDGVIRRKTTFGAAAWLIAVQTPVRSRPPAPQTKDGECGIGEIPLLWWEWARWEEMLRRSGHLPADPCALRPQISGRSLMRCARPHRSSRVDVALFAGTEKGAADLPRGHSARRRRH